ncbi:DUF4309 domain-containing protein [Chengkuizengella axinellae]|uniref:DUF4309 domain-containing protein n=1 Tax=Chengkuizengella axinellae TaxID=3064388 RepID=A0ABT9IY95_9BACL|nr:DUF4309 domain-containing protein [Chengkuizengella sp. 2205SS18-9]MDP5274327.1 DUF4309 domain-containing protein [Chengkuizengella sp. 2205SS18-9]
MNAFTVSQRNSADSLSTKESEEWVYVGCNCEDLQLNYETLGGFELFNNEINNEQDLVKLDENNDQIKTQFETVDMDEFREISKYNFIIEDNSEEYQVLLYPTSEKKIQQRETWACAQENDEVYAGNYELAWAKVSEKEGRVLDLGEMTLNMSRDDIYIVDGKPNLLVISQCEGSVIQSAHYYFLKNNELKQIKNINLENDFVLFGNSIKNLAPSKFQTVEYSNATIEWGFLTWELDAEKEILVNTNMFIIGGKDWDVGRTYFNMWIKNPAFSIPQDYIHPQQLSNKYEITSDFKVFASYGLLPGFEFGIGSAKKDIVNKWGEPAITLTYREGPFISYSSIAKCAFHYNSETGDVWAVSVNNVSTNMAEIKKLLGEPKKDYFDDYDNAQRASYILGDYEVSFIYEKESGNVWFMFYNEI